MFSDARQIIENYFRANWTRTLAVYDNDDTKGKPNESWIRLTIIQNAHFSEYDGYFSFSPTTIRYRGHIAIQLFVPLNVGHGVMNRLADEISQLLVNRGINGIQLKAPSIQRIGPSEGWFQVNIITPYYWDTQLKGS